MKESLLTVTSHNLMAQFVRTGHPSHDQEQEFDVLSTTLKTSGKS